MKPSLSQRPPLFPPALMVQGTCSNAGKSLLTAALCRIFARRGLNVAPFKAQNMALNSFVTEDGGEMGRAQALQAMACGLEADVRMNPVLLKPVSEKGSQVIVMGRPAGSMHARDWAGNKAHLWRAVRTAYAELALARDIMVLEGAGSPAEINLRKNDIVNMRMARHAGAHVILVADIDRGGAFAAIVGTMRLLTPSERRRVCGFVLNKFRGDASLLAPAIDRISAMTGKPFLGVVPWLDDLRLPEEDSVSFKLGLTPGMEKADVRADTRKSKADTLDIAVIDLPRISNFTDFDALRLEDGIRLRRVGRPDELGSPDCIVLPGTRNTGGDARFLEESGLFAALQAYGRRCLNERQGTLVGICGGLQLLGTSVTDPTGLEEGGTIRCLGLLPIRTELSPEKTLRRTKVTADAALAGEETPAFGYEIHHGETQTDDDSAPKAPLRMTARPVMRNGQGETIGWAEGSEARARIWGTYLHGVFDADAFRHAFCNALRADRGLAPKEGRAYDIGPSLDRLADTVFQAIDIPALLSRLFPESALKFPAERPI